MSDMTFEEMQRRYDGEWLLIASKEVDEELVIKGEVLAHSRSREEIYQALDSIEEQPLAIEYVGQVSEDLGFILL